MNGRRIAWALLLAAATAGTVRAGDSWAAKSANGGRREISADEARKSAAAQAVDRRNKLTLRRIRPAMPGVDWDADPTAIPMLLYQVNQRTALPVHVDNEGLDLASDRLFENLAIYLTSHTRWSLNEKETENLERFLKRGGTLYLDDCYNRGSAFTECVRPELTKISPGAAPVMVLRNDPVVADAFSLGYPGLAWPGEGILNGNLWQYYIIDGRPAVFFSPNDDGCAWEVSTPPSASNPIGDGIGHGGDNTAREKAYQWCTTWMIYAYTH